MIKNTFTVETLSSGAGYFVHGGKLGSMFIQEKADAEKIAAALNLAEKIKLKATARKVNDLINALQEFASVVDLNQ